MTNSRYAIIYCIVCLLSTSLAFALTESDAKAGFQKLGDTHKAIAVSGSGAQAISSTVHSQSSPAVASIKALASCEAKRTALKSDNFCEIRAVNGNKITSAQKIRAAVPDQHPLFLWEIVSSQAKVYLAGSIHVLKQSLYPLPQQYQSAFDSSDNIVVEVETASVAPGDMADLVKMYFLFPESQSIQHVLNESETALLSEYLRYRNTSIEAVEQLKPSMLAIQLSLNQLVAMGYTHEYGVESFFLSQTGSKNIFHLETLAQQFQLLGSAPMDLQRELLRESIVGIDEVDAAMAELVTAWLSGDADSFEALTKSMSSESPEYLAFSKKLLEERNIGMANKIESYLNKKGTYFVMLGAAHLMGERSVLSLLEQQGRTVNQIHSGDQIQGLSH